MKIKKIFNNLIKMYNYGEVNKHLVIGYGITTLFMTGVSVAIPILAARQLVTLTNELYKELILVSITIFIIELSFNCTLYLSRRFLREIEFSAINLLQFSMINETLKISNKELDKYSTGVLIDRINRDTYDATGTFRELFWSLTEVIRNIGVMAAIFIISRPMFIYTILMITTIYSFEHFRMKFIFKFNKEAKEINEKNTGMLSEAVRGGRDIKALNADETFLEKIKNNLLASTEKTKQMSTTNINYNFWGGSITDLTSLGYTFLGIWLIMNHQLSAASLIILVNYEGRARGLIRHFVFSIENFKKFNLSANRVFELIEDKFEKETFGQKKLDNFKKSIVFKDISFGYNKDKKVISNLNLTINKNQTVAFVGKSGSGKTTIFNLLTKMYEANSGEILIDDLNLLHLNKQSIRDNFSLVTQSPYIFNFSIKENLSIIKPNLTDEEMVEVCKIAQLHDFIETLPDKYDTVVGEGGITLSGGQKQRLAIARALLKKSPIILFDEATSALDNHTQAGINTALKNMKGNYTILIIAHRLSTVIDSDKIFLVDKGNIIAEGSHEYLMKNNDFYKKLYKKER